MSFALKRVTKESESVIIAVFGLVIITVMLPIANIHLKDLYDTALDFFAANAPNLSSFRPQQPDIPPSTSPPNNPVLDPLSRFTRECASLRERLSTVDGRQSTCSCNTPLSSMRRELDVTKNELARSHSDVARLDERCKMLERTLRETKELLRSRDAEIEKLKREREKEKERALVDRRRSEEAQGSVRESREQRHRSLDTQSTHSQETLKSSSDLSRWPSSESLALSAMSNEEWAQRRSAEAFMTRTDSWSGAQVLQAVQDLNSEILQFAASATELCTFEKDVRPPSSRSIQAMHDTSSRLGQNFTRILASRDHSQDPLLVQLALQGCISICIQRALSSFCIGYPSKSDGILAQIYGHMSLVEPQPTSSKWRALTHRQLHTMYPTLNDYAVNEICETIFRWSADVFIISGCSSYDTKAASSREGLRLRFSEQVRRIAKSVTRLARVTREEIMSTCFEVVATDLGEAFNPGGMVDAFKDYGASRGSILATTELGLKCTTRKGGSEVVKAEQDVTLEQRILLAPKVVLESVLDVLDPK